MIVQYLRIDATLAGYSTEINSSFSSSYSKLPILNLISPTFYVAVLVTSFFINRDS